MPRYEYLCPVCQKPFTALRKEGERNEPIRHDCGPEGTLAMFPAKRTFRFNGSVRVEDGTPRFHGDD